MNFFGVLVACVSVMYKCSLPEARTVDFTALDILKAVTVTDDSDSEQTYQEVTPRYRLRTREPESTIDLAELFWTNLFLFGKWLCGCGTIIGLFWFFAVVFYKNLWFLDSLVSPPCIIPGFDAK